MKFLLILRLHLNVSAFPVRLRGGSNGFLWVAADLPPGTTGPGLAKPCGTSEAQTFMKPLAAGDVVTGRAIYSVNCQGQLIL